MGKNQTKEKKFDSKQQELISRKLYIKKLKKKHESERKMMKKLKKHNTK